MNSLRLFAVVLAAFLFVNQTRAAETVAPADAAKRVAAGEAVLIDVREPDEWEDGVAKPALLLALSDLRGDRKAWTDALEQHRGKELILYCRSGNRSGIAAEILEKEGYRVSNAGGFAEWRDAGLPVRTP